MASSLSEILHSTNHPLHYITWLLAGVVSHIGWGIYPVCSRYLQVRANQPLGTLQVLFLISGISIAILACYTFYDVRYKNGELPFKGITKPAAKPGSKLIDFRQGYTSKLSAVLMMGLALACRALTNMYSARYTAARWVQLLNMLSPLFVSGVSTLVLKQPLPDHFVPTFSLMTVGSILTVFGGAAESRASHAASFDLGENLLGLFLALLSAISLAGYMLGVYHSKGVLAESEVLYVNYLLFVVVLDPITFDVEKGPWKGMRNFTALDWSVLIGYAVLVYLGSNLIQQMVIRKIGAPVTAMFLGVRLVSACIAGYLLLNERITSAVEWIGLFIVGTTVTWYLYSSWRKTEQAKKRGLHLSASIKAVDPSEGEPLYVPGRPEGIGRDSALNGGSSEERVQLLNGGGGAHSHGWSDLELASTSGGSEAALQVVLVDGRRMGQEELHRVRGPGGLLPRGLGYLQGRGGGGQGREGGGTGVRGDRGSGAAPYAAKENGHGPGQGHGPDGSMGRSS